MCQMAYWGRLSLAFLRFQFRSLQEVCSFSINENMQDDFCHKLEKKMKCSFLKQGSILLLC